MAAIVIGERCVFGIQDPKKIIGAPEGRQRLRLRSNGFARLFVKTDDGIREFCLEDGGDHWRVGFETGRNKTA